MKFASTYGLTVYLLRVLASVSRDDGKNPSSLPRARPVDGGKDKVSNPKVGGRARKHSKKDSNTTDSDDSKKDGNTTDSDDSKKDGNTTDSDDSKDDIKKDDNITGGAGIKGDDDTKSGDKDFNWITPEIVKVVNGESLPIDKIPSLKEKGVYLRPLDDKAAEPLGSFHQQEYVEQVWSLIANVFDKEIRGSKQVSGHPAIEGGVRTFLHTIYDSALRQKMTTKDLVILTSLAFYNSRDLSSLISQNQKTSTGGFTGIRREDFDRLNGASLIRPGSRASSGDLYKLIDSRGDKDAISAGMRLYKQMVADVKPEGGDANMAFILSLYYPNRYNKKLAAADNGIGGDDLIAQAAANPQVATDLIRMAYFYNRLSANLVNLFSTGN